MQSIRSVHAVIVSKKKDIMHSKHRHNAHQYNKLEMYDTVQNDFKYH